MEDFWDIVTVFFKIGLIVAAVILFALYVLSQF